MSSVQSLEGINVLLHKHENWRSKCLNMIASENIPSPYVRRYLTSDFGGRYPTYHDDPATRNYFGNEYMAEMEMAAHDLAKQVYEADYVEFRPLGGSMAVNAVLLALLKPGDTVFETGDCFGGQKVATKLISANLLSDLVNIEYVPYDIGTHDIDIDKLTKDILKASPKLVILGSAHILFPDKIKPLRPVIDQVGAYLAYDFSHINGLVAGKAFPNPLDQGADIVMGSHHKSLPGPQGGLYYTRDEDLFRKVRKGLYPPLVTNHHLERAPALAATYLEVLEYGEAYATQVARNSAMLGQALFDLGIKSLYPERGFSQSHQVLVDVEEYGGGRAMSTVLEKANIVTGPGAIPKDLQNGGKLPSGIRFGTQELTRIGMVESDMESVANFVRRVIVDDEDPLRVARDVGDFVAQFNELKFCFVPDVSPYEPIY